MGGKEIRSGDVVDVTSPHKHRHVIARAHLATADTVRAAAKSAIESQRDWAALRFEDRAAVFLRAAEMLATTHRALLNGSTMLGQSKTAFQAEIDSACELIDFFRFNVAYAERLYREQPESSPGVWNRMEHRPLEGFVYAVTPFNFTAIGGNLPGAPALMGNTAVWKPSHTALLSNYYVYKLLETAGLPPGVINFVPAEPVMCTATLVDGTVLRRHPLHRIDGGVPADLAPGREPAGQVRLLSADRGRNRRQGLRRGAPERRPGRGGGRPRARGVRVPGAEVQRGIARLHPRHDLARGARPDGRDDGRDQDGRRRRLQELHGCRDRQEVVRSHCRLSRGGEGRTAA